MEKLIYRGVEHDGVTATTVRTKAALIYRGQAHDGMPRSTPTPRREIRMVYRGIGYMVSVGAADVAPGVLSGSTHGAGRLRDGRAQAAGMAAKLA